MLPHFFPLMLFNSFTQSPHHEVGDYERVMGQWARAFEDIIQSSPNPLYAQQAIHAMCDDMGEHLILPKRPHVFPSNFGDLAQDMCARLLNEERLLGLASPDIVQAASLAFTQHMSSWALRRSDLVSQVSKWLAHHDTPVAWQAQKVLEELQQLDHTSLSDWQKIERRQQLLQQLKSYLRP